MATRDTNTTVVIIGGGASGLTLATLLHQSGVACIVLERRDRAYIAMRQRAGVVEARGVQIFERWGLADKLLGGPIANTVEYRVDGVGRVFEVNADDGSPSRFCTQQMLVNNLLRELIDIQGGDIRFEISNVRLLNEEGQSTQVHYTDATGSHVIQCDYIAGCDADHGVSRASIPEGVLKTYTHEFGYAWLAALVEAPAKGHAIMAVSEHGFAAQIPRGPQRSRYYLQCALSDGAADWPDYRLWTEIRLRLGDTSIQQVEVRDKLFVPLRTVVHAPMRHRNLFLVGDAAHLVPPTGAKGMNLSLFDADILARAVAHAVRTGHATQLESYSDTCLPHVWKYQEFSQWMTDTMHDAGDPTLHGEFRKQIARTRLDTPSIPRRQAGCMGNTSAGCSKA